MRRTFAVLTVLTIGLGGMAACTRSTTTPKATASASPSPTGLPSDPAAALRWAAAQTQAAGSAKIDATSQSPAGGKPQVIKGALSWAGEGQLAGTISGSPGISQFSPDGTVTMLVTGGDMYLKLTDPKMLTQSGGRSWMKLDFAELATLAPGSGGADLGSVMGSLLKQLSPGVELRALAGGTGLTNDGPEVMDGVRTTHFSGTLTPQQLLAAMPGLTAQQRDALAKQDQAAGVTSESVDVWLDAHGLPIRTEDHASSNAGAFDVDRHFSAYGTQVQVTTPDAADVLDLAAVLKACGSGCGSGGATGGTV
ncbi:hypothetical protein [Streptacidiphilus jiangxiensis]|uniref:Lipoprotein n=1 Tax=Streptacidiphilus jiangxiensis TaxID=235985 RepID=A0A1H7M4U1_STRJI|nr:hypothetical protein [Streptacidiphilus jiangxiensis]SEL05735.1 hypothetical protein SAMN05414137_105158 [Streptacidiphilus jiangxiensis]